MSLPLFVYGSLRGGFPNHFKLADATVAGEWATVEKYSMIATRSGSYPYVCKELLHESCVFSHIHGELYWVCEELFASLDEMEGHPTEYRRTLVPIQNGSETLWAFMYILESVELKEGIRNSFSRRFWAIPTGDWATAQGETVEPSKEMASRDIAILQKKYTNHVFVHVHRSSRSTDMPPLDKHKFIVPRDMTVGSFLYVVRKRMQLPPEKALFLFVDNTLPTSSSRISDLYAAHGRDGILEVYYAGENTFG